MCDHYFIEIPFSGEKDERLSEEHFPGGFLMCGTTPASLHKHSRPPSTKQFKSVEVSSRDAGKVGTENLPKYGAEQLPNDGFLQILSA